MESLSEEQLIQMVRDFIESEPNDSHISEPLPLVNNSHATHIDTLKEIIWSATEGEVEIAEKIMTYVRNIGSSKESNNMNKWLVLRLKMDGFEASLCKTWISFHGDYEFVEVMIKGKGNGTLTRVIVDIDFRSNFELARPTQSYKKLVDTLPTIFVGNEEKLGNVVTLLCSAAKQSLKENGLYIPPWRKANFMLTKWLSDKCKKISVSPNMELME